MWYGLGLLNFGLGLLRGFDFSICSIRFFDLFPLRKVRIALRKMRIAFCDLFGGVCGEGLV